MFDALIGNQPTKKYLERMFESCVVPSTLLFFGPEGVGKSLFAKEFAKMLMGASHARKIDSGSHPDFHTYRPVGKSAMHSAENIYQLIDEIALPPFEAPCKIFLIYDAERMLPTSSNALLKTLEEPPADTYLILLSNDAEALLSTILSRCRKISFSLVSEKEIFAYLRTTLGKSETEAHTLALLAQGSVAKACALSSIKEDPLTPHVVALMQAGSYPELAKHLTALEKQLAVSDDDDEDEAEVGAQKKEINAFLEQLLAWYRDAHLLAAGGSLDQLFHREHLSALQHTVARGVPPLETVITLMGDCRHALQHNIKLRTVLENFFFKTLI